MSGKVTVGPEQAGFWRRRSRVSLHSRS